MAHVFLKSNMILEKYKGVPESTSYNCRSCLTSMKVSYERDEGIFHLNSVLGLVAQTAALTTSATVRVSQLGQDQ